MGPQGKGAPAERGEEAARPCCGCRFPLLLALLQLALGLAVTVLGFLMASASSSLPLRATPFWAGITVCLVAYLGLFMLCVSYQVDERTCIQFAMKLMKTEGVWSPEERYPSSEISFLLSPWARIYVKAPFNSPQCQELGSQPRMERVSEQNDRNPGGHWLHSGNAVNGRTWASECVGVSTYETSSNIPFLCDFPFSLPPSFLPSFLLPFFFFLFLSSFFSFKNFKKKKGKPDRKGR
nr:sarcospan isoform X1 [Manis javanica]